MRATTTRPELNQAWFSMCPREHTGKRDAADLLPARPGTAFHKYRDYG